MKHLAGDKEIFSSCLKDIFQSKFVQLVIDILQLFHCVLPNLQIIEMCRNCIPSISTKQFMTGRLVMRQSRSCSLGWVKKSKFLIWAFLFAGQLQNGVRNPPKDFGCPDQNSETTFISPTSPKNDGITFGLKRLPLLDWF